MNAVGELHRDIEERVILPLVTDMRNTLRRTQTMEEAEKVQRRIERAVEGWGKEECRCGR